MPSNIQLLDVLIERIVIYTVAACKANSAQLK